MASSSSSMAERRQNRKIAEARQAGTLAPETDEDGRMVNPHNPEYITKRPWYLGEGGGIKHHAKQKQTHLLSLVEADELVNAARVESKRKKRQRAAGYRKGACQNCGSMTHKAKDCLERPRSKKTSARHSGLDIAADDVTVDLEQHGKLAFDAKRDGYQGFDVDHHQKLLREKFEKLEAERRRVRREEREQKRREKAERKEARQLAKEARKKAKEEEKAKAKAEGGDGDGDDKEAKEGEDKASGEASDSDSESDSDSSDSDDDLSEEEEEDDFVEKDENAKDFQGRVARQGGVGGAQMFTTVRNLRVREDTAKYLLNLDPNSAYYDPKSRAMRDNPLPHMDPNKLVYAGDNFVRSSGDSVELARTQVFAWNAEDRGTDIHMQAAPSQAELARKHHEKAKVQLEEDKKKAIAEKYGVAKGAKMQSMDPRLALGQTETMAEYTPDGRLLRGAATGPVRSKYEEDVFPGNHTSVWGSWYDLKRGTWGYRCCHSASKHSYCTGEAGKAANAASEAQRTGAALAAPKRKTLAEAAEDQSEEQRAAAREKAERAAAAFKNRSSVFGEADAETELDSGKLRAALDKAKGAGRDPQDPAARYNSNADTSVTNEDMEAYRMTKNRADDPMAKFMDNGDDDVLPVD